MIIVYKSFKYILQQETLYNRDIKVKKRKEKKEDKIRLKFLYPRTNNSNDKNYNTDDRNRVTEGAEEAYRTKLLGACRGLLIDVGRCGRNGSKNITVSLENLFIT